MREAEIKEIVDLLKKNSKTSEIKEALDLTTQEAIYQSHFLPYYRMYLKVADEIREINESVRLGRIEKWLGKKKKECARKELKSLWISLKEGWNETIKNHQGVNTGEE